MGKPSAEVEYPLFEYGIKDEQSDIRAHVGPLSRTIYACKTDILRELVKSEKYKIRKAFQQGYDFPTAEGACIPINDIPDLRILKFHSYDWDSFPTRESNTTDKGKAAVGVVVKLLELGRFPLWVIEKESDDAKIQILGTDLIVALKQKIQVKCDWKAGKREDHQECSGNLYIQIREVNPFGRH